MKKFLCLILFSYLISIPTKDDFNQKFIEVAKNGNPTVVSIISETVNENSMFQGFGRILRNLKICFQGIKKKEDLLALV